MPEQTTTQFRENLDRVESAIAEACRRAGRKRREVELMAVSKTYPAATITEAARLGLRLFGENRVQEFAAKAPELDPWRVNGAIAASDVPIIVHLIGHLQSNKAAKAAELFDAIDSLDSLRLAERLNEAAAVLHKRLPVLIEVKLSPEETKAGIDPESTDAAALLERLPDLTHLHLRGLMTIAPWGVAEDLTRACLRSLRQWRDRWAAAHPRLKFDVLSMGMSGDFAIAIEEGATRIRVGTALFGEARAVHGTRLMNPIPEGVLRETKDGVTLAVRAQPGAKKTAIVGVYGEGARAQLKIAVKAPPIEGRANEALIEFLAGSFSVPRTSVVLICGELNRSKVFLFRGVTSEMTVERLSAIHPVK